MKPRTRARSIALQALYEIDLTGQPPELVLNERLSETPLEDNLGEFARNIVMGILPIIHELDQIIAKHAPEWPLDQVAIIDRNIMRIALWEIAVSNQTPLKVAINEAVELGKLYGSESTPRFVNGVLGSLAIHYNDIVQYFKNVSV
ncbi:MAG: transcription antitermination factor NusB [Acidobacteriaceae bacterium]